MSGNAPAGGDGRVGWQVDVPSLASLVTKLSVEGLKRFAEAGVHFHTIICMAEIAEKCPASNEYRKRLSDCRQEQRKQSQWLYKIVEVGAATNFVADELLKHRAGENVVALMSSILPVMSGSSCDNLLLSLFEASETPLDKTPGFGQLKSIRETLLPLARRTPFKDRVFQYHHLARKLLERDNTTLELSSFESIPSEVTAARVILFLAQVAQENPDTVLEYQGLKGAGWIIAYARHVLGLPVCVLKSSSSSVPISGDYRTAKVFVHIHKVNGECQLFKRGTAQDFFLPRSIDPTGYDGWVIDPYNINVLDSYVPKGDALRQHISVIARSMVDDYMEILVCGLSLDPCGPEQTGPGLITYPTYCLPTVHQKAQSFLDMLGFDPVKTDLKDLGSCPWSQYVRLPMVAKTKNGDGECCTTKFEAYLVAGPLWVKSEIDHIDDLSLDEDAGHASKEHRVDEVAMSYISSVLRMVEAACWLAFSDWDQHVRLLSLSSLENHGVSRKAPFQGRPLMELLELHQFHEDRDCPVRLSVVDLSRASLDWTIGGHDWTIDYINDSILAFQHKGLVFAKHTAMHHRINLDACFISIIPGAIVADGEIYRRIYTSSQDPTDPLADKIDHNIERSSSDLYRPVNLFPGLSITTHVSLSADGIEFKQTVAIGNQILSIPKPGSASRALKNLRVTTACEHHYYDSLSISKFLGPHAGSCRVLCGLGLSSPTTRQPDTELWLNAVDRNSLGQWLGIQGFGQFDGPPAILQRNCCLACLLQRIARCTNEEEDSAQSFDMFYPMFRIIHGNLPDEVME